MTKIEAIARLEIICAASQSNNECYIRETCVKEWQTADGAKSRTYLSIVETTTGSKHYKKKDYGYYDNISCEYVPAKYGNINNNYDFSGEKF